MDFGEFLTTAPSGIPAPSLAVSFRAIARDQASGSKFPLAVRARLVFLDEEERRESVRDAQKVIRTYYEGGSNADALLDEEWYQVLRRALRDEDDVRKPFFKSDLEIRRALSIEVFKDLIKKYGEFVLDQFPKDISQDQFAKLVDEAKKNSLTDLLGSYGSSAIRAVLPHLAVTSPMLPTETSFGGPLP